MLSNKKQNKEKKLKKPINNLYLWIALFCLMILVTSVIIIFTNNEFEQIRDFWGWWLVWSAIIGIFSWMLTKWTINLIKCKKSNPNLLKIHKNNSKEKRTFK